ncbi:Hypothetical protein PENO1_106480 [Penicillium occitanis (nom. inval.)]|nr:Hypothetical protein PENO1_106480 [Penicillium occitanis (nom. inval.)]PCG89345.1 hypothetical protein PENOC_106910 [Penicillium occitanis (nom. inval.)]
MFRRLAHAAVLNLDNVKSGQDRSFWRIAHQYLIVINEFENFRPFRAPRKAHLNHKVKPDLLIAMLSVEQVQLGGETYRFQQRTSQDATNLNTIQTVKEKFPGLSDKLGEEHVHFVDAINNNFVHPEIEQNNEIKNVAVSSSELDTEAAENFGIAIWDALGGTILECHLSMTPDDEKSLSGVFFSQQGRIDISEPMPDIDIIDEIYKQSGQIYEHRNKFAIMNCTGWFNIQAPRGGEEIRVMPYFGAFTLEGRKFITLSKF